MNNRYKELIKQLSTKELLFHLYGTQILLLTIALILGMILFDSLSAFFDLFKWSDPNILFVGGIAGVGVVLVDMLLMKVLPPSFYDDGGLNEKIFRNVNIAHIAVISAVVATGEEILFRGVIQTNFGIIVSSIIFALVHYRYLFNWFLFSNIVLLSFLIGFVFYWTNNLLVTVFMHFLIDFLLGLTIKYRKNDNQLGQEGMFHE
ncbi:CPBP family intramembrane metalloprotease [Bacillus canaveralius]|uniref:CPBP family intramembrane metalloprotease n=1 Tax=Bacillus canaveralius TaxID=1403243 RepID=A0A2N5GRP9_9BACI|nr:CPBP family intramembrane glutamic endopeptidase [Bacillus canaveralius]PLR86108.1 CPBP family intramembrane metalloprotease [Bacillus canaveralius]PLS00228.1 CPBP family intramembrane metalloprotease [Bacillus canaveralius]RSK52008.1 CPBP family intramembrane metalloprotease [Bacillus canaveralius]